MPAIMLNSVSANATSSMVRDGSSVGYSPAEDLSMAEFIKWMEENAIDAIDAIDDDQRNDLL